MAVLLAVHHRGQASARRTQVRKRSDAQVTVLIALVFGILGAPTAFGQRIADVTGRFAEDITRSGR
ncbi:hypothetical protein ACFYXC_12605 [Streptomyces sp. NPDC002701]|uniref:hypothetical protein n=1 Tax=Streptomyces sp. NPDC002701 TaxID=3364661 RepID=UPI00368981F6